MSTTFTPEIGTVTVNPAPVTRKGLLNAPAVGTPIRATLGETVIVGKVHHQQKVNEHKLLYIAPDGQGHWETPMSCWLDAGWTFELLDSADGEVAA